MDTSSRRVTAFDTYNTEEAGGMYQINRHTEPAEHKNLTQFAGWLHCQVSYSTIYLMHSASLEVAVEVFSNQHHDGMRLPWQLKSIATASGRPVPLKKTSKQHGRCMGMRMRSAWTYFTSCTRTYTILSYRGSTGPAEHLVRTTARPIWPPLISL